MGLLFHGTNIPDSSALEEDYQLLTSRL